MGEVRRGGAWASAENAEAYARYCREFSLYRETSETLAGLAGLESAGRVVDLACGTGATTRAILARLPAAGRVLALDGSAAMLAVARRDAADPRVAWVDARAEDLAAHLDRPADAVVCNSAFWQMDMPAVASAVRAVLRPGGRFVCNVGAQFIDLPGAGDQARRSAPSLFELMMAAAVLHHGFVPRLGGGPRLTVAGIVTLLEAAGLEVEPVRTAAYGMSHESVRAWMSIPAFTDRPFPGLTYEERMDALAIAYARLDRSQPPVPSRWAVFAARA